MVKNASKLSIAIVKASTELNLSFKTLYTQSLTKLARFTSDKDTRPDLGAGEARNCSRGQTQGVRDAPPLG